MLCTHHLLQATHHLSEAAHEHEADRREIDQASQLQDCKPVTHLLLPEQVVLDATGLRDSLDQYLLEESIDHQMKASTHLEQMRRMQLHRASTTFRSARSIFEKSWLDLPQLQRFYAYFF